jgi:hypothetical protein
MEALTEGVAGGLGRTRTPLVEARRLTIRLNRSLGFRWTAFA